MLDDIKKRKNDFKKQLESDLKKQDDPTDLILGAQDAVNKALGIKNEEVKNMFNQPPSA